MDGQLRPGIFLPKRAAVRNVFTQQLIVQTGVTKLDRHGEVHAAHLLDLLGQQVAAVLGSARLAHQMDLAVLNGDHGLDGKHLAHRAHRAGDSAAATQVLKGIEQADDNHAIARGLDASAIC